jgi:hypothetical protein
MEPLFPIHSPASPPGDAVLTIEPYYSEGMWVFDEPSFGLHREPFVSGVTEMIDRLVADVPNARGGFHLLFSAAPFKGHQTSLTLMRPDPVEGHWYRAEDQGDEGWLCPALMWFFPQAPARIYVRAEPK